MIPEKAKLELTKKLLRNYRRLKGSAGINKKFSEAEKAAFEHEGAGYVSAMADAMQDSAIITLWYICRIESAAELFRKECEETGKPEILRRYKEFEMMHLSDRAHTAEEIAELQNVSVKSVYKDLGIAYKAICSYLFGSNTN